ncbi:helix-turn-helix domain-containing protein [Escherichia coli]|uniref:Putative phage replication protein n=1 Tax=Escherichia coli TaxID=562 RepID=A0A377FA22_ECOLX|nr:helix-turn-helix domain-containing protein [Escherichia coli]STN83110.1 putative phage replication protein [Escherichia coli]
MSMKLMAKAMEIKVGNPLRKLVLIKLADNASDQGECWPSYQYIADQCEISKRSVINHIAALCESGMVKKITRKGEKGNTSNIYLLHLDGAENLPGNSANNSLHCASDASGSAGVAPVASAGVAPRTSHSFEPVNEPDVGGSADADPQVSHRAKNKIDWQRVLDSYHEILPEMPSVKILTDTRKKNLRTFWQKFGFDQQRWESYLRYVAENCRWMLEDRPNGSGGFWKRKNLDYLITERCYVAVKEARANDR